MMGEEFSYADLALYTILVRMQKVFVPLFRLLLKPLSDYSNLSRLLASLGGKLGAIVKMDDIAEHYFSTFRWLNPMGIVPKLQENGTV